MENHFRFRAFLLLVVLILPVMIVAAGDSAAADDEPTIAKDSILVNAYTLNVYHKNYDNWSWVPKINFRVNGPIASGSQLYVEFKLPTGAPWVKFDCKTGNIEKGHWWKTECGARDIPEDKGITSTGSFGFTIGMRNELASTDATLFTGKVKVAKAHSNEVGPKAVNKWVYYVDEDWALPIGYVFLEADDAPAGWNFPGLNLAFWVRGESANLEPHLFYQGKEVGKKFYQGEEVGKAGCDEELQTETTQFVDEKTPQKAKWERVKCTFYNVRGWDKREDKSSMFGPPFLLSENPGEYEFKALWNGHLARSIKFTVGPDGKFDNGIATANKLGSNRVIVPVQLLGTQDGTWDKTAWKTGAFYGNPLTGFTPAP
jgi:hypothetical protein